MGEVKRMNLYRHVGRGALSALLLFLPWCAQGGGGPSVLIKTATLTKRTLSETITTYGRTQNSPGQLSAITLPRAGIVTRLWVRMGQRVKPGQRLLELTTAPSAMMQYQQAKANVENARTKLHHLQNMLKQKLATQNQIADARRNLQNALATLHAQEKLGTSRAKQTIRAPFAGIVTKLPVNQGQRVQAKTMAMLLASGENLVVLLGLETEDAVRVKAGQAVTLSPVFGHTPVIHTKVQEVHAMVNPKTRLVDAFVHIPNKFGSQLVLNEAMRGAITLRRIDALAVPRSAILKDSKGSYVFVVRNGTAHRVGVDAGLEQGGYVAIRGDVKTGDKVVTLGNYELRDGMAVREGP